MSSGSRSPACGPSGAGGAKPTFVRHVFDGKRYVEKERTPGTPVPPGKALFDDVTFDKGIPLEPRS